MDGWPPSHASLCVCVCVCDCVSHGATLRPQAANSNTSSDGSSHEGFVRIPSGAYHKVVEEGTGRVPKDNDTVKVDIFAWRYAFDAFDSQNMSSDLPEEVCRVADWDEWYREAFLSMRVGEVRRIKLPDGVPFGPYIQLRLVSIL